METALSEWFHLLQILKCLWTWIWMWMHWMPYRQYSSLSDVLLLDFIHSSGTVHTGGKNERFKFWPDFSALLGAGLLEELCSFTLTMLRLLHFFLVGLLSCATEILSSTGRSSGVILGRRGGKKKLGHSPLTPTRGGGLVMARAVLAGIALWEDLTSYSSWKCRSSVLIAEGTSRGKGHRCRCASFSTPGVHVVESTLHSLEFV